MIQISADLINPAACAQSDGVSVFALFACLPSAVIFNICLSSLRESVFGQEEQRPWCEPALCYEGNFISVVIQWMYILKQVF